LVDRDRIGRQREEALLHLLQLALGDSPALSELVGCWLRCPLPHLLDNAITPDSTLARLTVQRPEAWQLNAGAARALLSPSARAALVLPVLLALRRLPKGVGRLVAMHLRARPWLLLSDARRDALVAAGAPAVLVDVLRSSLCESMLTVAAAALRMIVAGDGEGVDARRESIDAVGGTAALVAAVQRPEPDVAAEATAALCNLAAGGGEGAGALRNSIASAGGVAALVAATQRPEPDVAGPAATALRNLAAGGGVGAEALRDSIASAGGVAALVAVAQRPEPHVAADAAAALRNLAAGSGSGGEMRRAAIITAGGGAALTPGAARA
jgi:hypothetical protein